MNIDLAAHGSRNLLTMIESTCKPPTVAGVQGVSVGTDTKEHMCNRTMVNDATIVRGTVLA